MFLRSLTLALVLSALCAGVQAQQGEPAVLEAEDLQGGRRALEELRGKIVVLNFWATWCVPCREEMPLLGKLHREYEKRGVVVLGVSTDAAATQAKIAPFVRELKIPFPIWRGATVQQMQRLGLGWALPATAVLDREGRIIFRILGPVTEPELRARLDWLLAPPAERGPAPEAELNTFERYQQEQDHEGHAHAEGEHHEHEAHGEEDHAHGGTGMEGASTVPS